MALDDVGHPDAERLAEYADGVLEVEARAEIERHLADCEDCRAVVMETMLFLEANPATTSSASAPKIVPFRARRWVTGVAAGLAVAAALVLAVRIAQPAWMDQLFGGRGSRPELQALIAVVDNEPTRLVEGRLSGGFKYAPPPSPTRGPGGRDISPDVTIAAATIEKQLLQHETPDGRAALGVAYLAVGDVDKAVDALEEAVAQRPDAGDYQIDLSAAYLARARRDGRPKDAQLALAAAERAIKSSPDRPEAWFNRALALEALSPADQAQAAWNDYLQRDRDGEWRLEAQRRASGLSRPKS